MLFPQTEGPKMNTEKGKSIFWRRMTHKLKVLANEDNLKELKKKLKLKRPKKGPSKKPRRLPQLKPYQLHREGLSCAAVVPSTRGSRDLQIK